MSILHVLEDHEKSTCTQDYISQLSFYLAIHTYLYLIIIIVHVFLD